MIVTVLNHHDRVINIFKGHILQYNVILTKSPVGKSKKKGGKGKFS